MFWTNFAENGSGDSQTAPPAKKCLDGDRRAGYVGKIVVEEVFGRLDQVSACQK